MQPINIKKSQTLGPNEKADSVSNSTRRHILACNEYVGRLTTFSKYLLWRYSAGSASVNSYLIMGKLSGNALHWTYLFFLYWKNTAVAQQVDINATRNFTRYNAYFAAPESFQQLGKSDPSAAGDIAMAVIRQYIMSLNAILLACPRPTGSLAVYKVASKYPGLPTPMDKLPMDVAQMPFNSTTIDANFNFVLFVPKDEFGRPIGDNSVLFKLTIPPGSLGCLYVPSYVHAYSFEQEIILPTNCAFRVTQMSSNSMIPYVDPKTVRMDNVQPEIKNTNMGPVHDPNRYFPCGQYGCVKQMLYGVTIYTASYVSPTSISALPQ